MSSSSNTFSLLDLATSWPSCDCLSSQCLPRRLLGMFAPSSVHWMETPTHMNSQTILIFNRSHQLKLNNHICAWKSVCVKHNVSWKPCQWHLSHELAVAYLFRLYALDSWLDLVHLGGNTYVAIPVEPRGTKTLFAKCRPKEYAEVRWKLFLTLNDNRF